MTSNNARPKKQFHRKLLTPSQPPKPNTPSRSFPKNTTKNHDSQTMSNNIPSPEQTPPKHLFRTTKPKQPLNPNSPTFKKIQKTIETRLGQRKPNTQLDPLEIQQVAEIVDELLKHRTKMNSATDSRVAPATQKRQQAYEHPNHTPLPPPLKRTNSNTTIQGIYTLPSTDPENPPPNPPLDLNPSTHLSNKLTSNLLALIQVILILIFAIFIHYDDNNVSSISKAYIDSKKPTTRPPYDQNFYNPNYDRGPPPPPPPGYNTENEGTYDRVPYAQPVTNTPLEFSQQNLPQFYYYTPKTMDLDHWKFSTTLIITQLVIILAYILTSTYHQDADGSHAKHSVIPAYGGVFPADNPVFRHNSIYQDVHVMIFVGFGFLMTFLKKYGYSAVGYNLLIAAIAIQWSVICRGIFTHDEKGGIPIDITTLINGDFAAAAVLITFGAVLGVTSPFQLVTICLIEVFLYALNEFIGTSLLKAIDVGGSMFIHTFGAYFGLSMSLVLRKNTECSSTNEGSNYTSDLFAMIGTVFLWMFWPSFNGAMAEGDDQHRAVINTVLSLTASTVFTFAISGIVSPGNKFNMVHVQNATLAGGVAVGAVADLMIRPYGALIIGSLAGILSTLGYAYVTPFLQSKINLHDTCGVNNLHGMPGIMAGLAGVVMALLASEDDYGISLYKQYPAMAPPGNTSGLNELRRDLTSIEPGDGRSASQQALYQLLALGVTLCIAIVGGALTGLLMRMPVFGQVTDTNLFDDSKLWEVPELEDSVDKGQSAEKP